VTLDKVRAYYEHFDEWRRLESPTGRFEFFRTMSTLDRYLKPEGRILDLGGGPGRYAIELARKGHRVSLVDLSPRQLEVARQKIRDADISGNIESVLEADARDLCAFPAEAFDAVLALGPFYHLVAHEDRVRAVREIARVLKPRGTVFATFIPRLAGLRGLIPRAGDTPDQVSVETVARVLEQGGFHNPSASGFQEGFYPSAEEVAALFRDAGLLCRQVLSIRGLADGVEEALWRVQAEGPSVFREFLRVIEQTESESAVVALCGHAMFVGEKR